MTAVHRNILTIFISLGFVWSAAAQQSSQPQVKINMINVCTPSAEEQQEIASALARVPKQPLFSGDFEVDRGRTTLEEKPDFLQAGENTHFSGDTSTAIWVRIRREFAVQALFSTAQYSFSQDPKSLVETLVFHVRDPKDLLEISIEDNASAVTAPAAMLSTNTPASRVKLERFGKSSIVLARCLGSEGNPPPDQSAYEPLFRTASSVMANYRALLHANQTVPDELVRVSSEGTAKPKPASKTTAKKTTPGSK